MSSLAESNCALSLSRPSSSRIAIYQTMVNDHCIDQLGTLPPKKTGKCGNFSSTLLFPTLSLWYMDAETGYRVATPYTRVLEINEALGAKIDQSGSFFCKLYLSDPSGTDLTLGFSTITISVLSFFSFSPPPSLSSACRLIELHFGLQQYRGCRRGHREGVTVRFWWWDGETARWWDGKNCDGEMLRL